MVDSQNALDFFASLDALAGQTSGEPLPPAKYEFIIDNVKDIKKGRSSWVGNVELTVINDEDGNDGRKVFENISFDGYYIKNGAPRHTAFKLFSLVSCIAAKAMADGADALFIDGLREIPFFNSNPEEMIVPEDGEQQLRDYANRLIGMTVYGETVNKANQKNAGDKWVNRSKDDPEYREFASIKAFLKPSDLTR